MEAFKARIAAWRGAARLPPVQLSLSRRLVEQSRVGRAPRSAPATLPPGRSAHVQRWVWRGGRRRRGARARRRWRGRRERRWAVAGAATADATRRPGGRRVRSQAAAATLCIPEAAVLGPCQRVPPMGVLAVRGEGRYHRRRGRRCGRRGRGGRRGRWARRRRRSGRRRGTAGDGTFGRARARQPEVAVWALMCPQPVVPSACCEAEARGHWGGCEPVPMLLWPSLPWSSLLWPSLPWSCLLWSSLLWSSLPWPSLPWPILPWPRTRWLPALLPRKLLGGRSPAWSGIVVVAAYDDNKPLAIRWPKVLAPQRWMQIACVPQLRPLRVDRLAPYGGRR